MISRENLLEQQLREKTLEIERLENIIKEVREYISDSHVSVTQLEAGTGLLNTKDYVLEILDKENKE